MLTNYYMRATGACHGVPSPAHSNGHALRVKTAGSWPECGVLTGSSSDCWGTLEQYADCKIGEVPSFTPPTQLTKRLNIRSCTANSLATYIPHYSRLPSRDDALDIRHLVFTAYGQMSCESTYMSAPKPLAV